MENERITFKPKNIFSLIFHTFSLYLRLFPQILCFSIISGLSSYLGWNLVVTAGLIAKTCGFTILLTSFAAGLLSSLTVYKVAAEVCSGNSVNWKKAFESAMGNFGSCFKTYILVAAVTIIGFISFVLPTSILENYGTNPFAAFIGIFTVLFIGLFCFKFALSACLIFAVTSTEKITGFESIQRSKELLKGSTLRLIATYLLSSLFMFAIVISVAEVLSYIGFSFEIIFTYAGALIGYLSPVLLTLFYFDLKARNENLIKIESTN